MNQDQTDIKTPEYVSLQFQVAGLGSRASALIIDQLILMTLNAAVFIVLYIIMSGSSPLPFFLQMNDLPIGITIIALFIINWGYYFAFEFFYGGRTIGKKLLGIRVIQENGHSITLLSSFIRNLLRIIDSLPLGYFVGMIMVFFHSKHKRIGDLVAGTIVVHERKAIRKRKRSPLEKEIQLRGLTKELVLLDEWKIKSFGIKEWKLISTYSNRFPLLSKEERNPLTKQMAEILFPKMGLEIEEKSNQEVEDTLLVLYLILRDEWDFEL